MRRLILTVIDQKKELYALTVKANSIVADNKKLNDTFKVIKIY